MNPFLIAIVLGIIQGLTELLPVSSSAHVVVAEKLMGLDPSSPEMTLLLVMLHTGTMFAVIVFFWKRWRASVAAQEGVSHYLLMLVIATVLTGVVGEALVKIIEKTWFHGAPKAEIELLFSHLELIAPALALVGILIIIAGLRGRPSLTGSGLTSKCAALIGAVQGLCLPFRGFSRSGATISTALLAGVERARAEDFSFALAVILTPPVVAREALRLAHAEHLSSAPSVGSAVGLSLIGFVSAFLAGLLALKWLSKWLDQGRWHWFGIYCLVAAAGVALLHHAGY